MGKGAPVRWLENQRLRREIKGVGVEIGALWRRFPASSAARVLQVDRMLPQQLDKQYVELKGNVIAPDLVADGADLPCGDGSLDFIIASHVLEHLPLPLRALQRWHDALRPGGVLLLRVPDKRYTFDRNRQRTTLTHLIAEDEQPAQFDRRAHFADWVEHVFARTPSEPAFERDLKHLLEMDYSIHYHVWTSDDFAEIFDHLERTRQFRWDLEIFWKAHFYRKETVALLRKQ